MAALPEVEEHMPVSMLKRVDFPGQRGGETWRGPATCPVMSEDGGDLSGVDIKVHPLHSPHGLLAQAGEVLPEVPDHDGLGAPHGGRYGLHVLADFHRSRAEVGGGWSRARQPVGGG